MEQNFKLLPIFILILCFISCDNDHLETATITGFSQPKNYEKGTFSWEFNMNTKTVRIINTASIYDTLYTPSFMNNREGFNPFEIVEENSMNFLAVENRKGTEAAAVTAIGMGLTSVGSSNRRVRLNKPF